MCAIKEGASVDSTMGFTALDGLPMGTRPGQLDAGVLLYLLSEKKMSAKEIEHLLYKDSGLKGLSGISNDVRDLLASGDPRAKLALEFFIYRIVCSTGMLPLWAGSTVSSSRQASERMHHRSGSRFSRAFHGSESYWIRSRTRAVDRASTQELLDSLLRH